MNKYGGSNNVQEIKDLVKLLRQNGDKVLSASSKLSLSTTLLHNLNETFSLIVDESGDLESSFQVCNSSKIDIFCDLKFLHDFVQKTVGLKVIFCQDSPDLAIDITKFRCLKYLELKKIRVELVKGLQGVRGQLESVICAGRKGVSSLSQLLALCGGDAGVGFVWGSLKHLALPYNALESLDRSLELVPWLQILDLSHNLIRVADELACLPNLKHLNLGYNKLEAIPTFNKAASHSLQVLVLKNNYIENLNGLQVLECLIELELSYNCITQHSVLWPLERMSTLSWVSLEGNPISYHPKHRTLSIKYLHPSLADSKFVLDHIPLSRSEKQIVAENRLFSIRSEQLVSKEFLSSLSSSMNSSYLSTSISTSVNTELHFNKPYVEVMENTEKSVSKNKKKQNVREAIITEDEQERKDAVVNPSALSSSYLETSKDYLETKKQILALREKFGKDHWLSSDSGTFVQDIMGLQSSEFTDLTSTLTQEVQDTNILSYTHDSLMEFVKDPLNKVNDNLDSSMKEGMSNTSEGTEGIASNNEENIEENSMMNETTETIVNTLESSYDPEEETGDLYIVQQKRDGDILEAVFLIITDDDIKERDVVSGRLKYSWSTSSVLSCVLGRSEPISVDIIFDTSRKDRENRRYIVEPEDAKKIVSTISEKMKKRPILLKVFKCMKCSTHFSHDSEYSSILTTSLSGVKQLKCPTCESTLVIQTDDLSILDQENDEHPIQDNTPKGQHPDAICNTNLRHSESFSSIGSATSLEGSRESTPSTSALNKKYESDIEILSNPSQSSIEVLDDNSKTHVTPHRKRSSEERRAAIAPSLLTIPDTTPVMTGLTESSSSGSLTDSICTAYENKFAKHSNADEKSQSGNSDKETKFTPVANLTSMLGGLLQSIKIGNNKPLLIKTEESPHSLGNDIQYSYTDFSSVDHRIKLHIILNIFEHKNEELVLLLRADTLMSAIKDTFPSCLVLSTSKIYILRIDGVEGEDPQCWLHKEFSWTMDRLRSFAPLPFKQGILIEVQQPNKINEEYSTVTFACILQDFQRTSNFLFYITDLSLPPSCEVEFSVPDHCTNLLHSTSKNAKNYQEGDAVRLLALFSCGVLKSQEQDIQLKLSGLVITSSVLLILADNLQWLLPGSNELPVIKKEQLISNLVGIEHCGATLSLNFLDEVAGLEETWVVEFSSSSAAEAVISSIQPPWEELFSIPLQVTRLTVPPKKYVRTPQCI